LLGVEVKAAHSSSARQPRCDKQYCATLRYREGRWVPNDGRTCAYFFPALGPKDRRRPKSPSSLPPPRLSAFVSVGVLLLTELLTNLVVHAATRRDEAQPSLLGSLDISRLEGISKD
jgi:hypothetical protein